MTLEKSKGYKPLLVVGAVLILVLILNHKKKLATETKQPVNPLLDTYAKNPAAYEPHSLGTINVNVNNQALHYLDSQYIPLFGFVGVAQGMYFQ